MRKASHNSVAPPHTRLYAQRTLFIGTFASKAAMIACFVGAVASMNSFRNARIDLAMGLALLGGAIIISWHVFKAFYMRSLLARLEAAHGYLCPGCGYDLSAANSNPTATCPQCGRFLVMSRVRELWLSAFGKRRK